MAPRPEILSTSADPPPAFPDADGRPTAMVLPLRRTDSHGRTLVGETSGDRLGPARGLLAGLGLGACLWIALGLLAWKLLSH